ncbi:MAG: thermonuclease family protein [Firmicutes bacterium]|nr:thermonuclease family protein [Bacillota bacterium]
MKKILVLILAFFAFIINIEAKTKKVVTFNECIDGDTASVILNKEKIKIRFLAIDTPETKHPTIKEEPYGKEASNYTCNSLKKAKKIEIEYDNNSDKLDKYDRHLVWVFVDDELLQENLIEQGLAKVAYLYDDYKYTSKLETEELIAKSKRIGIWNEEIDYVKIIIVIIILIVGITLFITNRNFRTKTTNKIKKETKKRIKKYFKT